MDIFKQLELDVAKDLRVGPRKRNEDFAEVYTDLGLLVIADGMGGGDRGDLASRSACQAAADFWNEARQESYEGEELVDFVIRRVNTRIFELGKQQGLDLGTTVTLAALSETEVMVGHVGDTRLYRLRDDQVELLTEDQRAAGNVLRESIGGRDVVEPFVKRFDRRPGDVYVMATDGLWSLLTTRQIAALHRQRPPDELCAALMADRDELADDNYSALVCWDRQAVLTWWRQRADQLRAELRQMPAATTFEALRQAARRGGGRAEPGKELHSAWTPENDRALVDLASDELPPEALRSLLGELADRSPAAVVALADLLIAAGEDDPQAIATIDRAFGIAHRSDHALYLLKRTDGADGEAFRRLAGHLLDQDPGPWFKAWTRLWQIALESEGGAEVCRRLFEGREVPGATLVGAGDGSHPLDQLLRKVVDEAVKPVASGNQAAMQQLAQLKTSLEQLAGRLDRVEDGGRRAGRTLQGVVEQIQGTEPRLGAIERRLNEPTDAVTEEYLQRTADAINDRLGHLHNQLDQLASQVNGHDEQLARYRRQELESGQSRPPGDAPEKPEKRGFLRLGRKK